MKISARDLPLLARVLVRTYGWRGIGRRVAYELNHRSGHLARILPSEDRLMPAEPGWTWPLRFDLDEIDRGYKRLASLDAIREEVVADANRVLAGEMRFYGWTWKRVEWPPRWHVNPWSGYEYPRAHWTTISDFAPEQGDIKDVWEMSRLSFTYIFARAWVLTQDDRYPEAWWRGIEDWAQQNPPNRGVNWKCGQETSLRGIALQFGLMVFAGHPATTPHRLRIAGGLLQASVRRVLPTLRYSLSQRNNHAISEGVFLATMAVAGETSKQARGIGLNTLKEAIADQFYEDGWYAQHSFNYQRLAVHALVWLNRVQVIAGLPAEDLISSAIRNSAALMRTAEDRRTGYLPNFGPNDGAMLFQLTSCNYRDFRPLLATIDSDISDGDGRSRHNEESVWLGAGTSESVGEVADSDAHIVTMRGVRTHVVVRSGTGRHRPNHDDLLHIDFWVDGQNVLADPGTYRYTAPAPWANALATRRVHNVPYTEGGSENRIGRFLVLAWPAASVLSRRDGPQDDVEHLRLCRVDAKGKLHRTVVRRGDHYLVVDHATGAPFAVRWTFGVPARLSATSRGAEVHAGAGHAILYGDIDELRPVPSEPCSGWVAPGYGGRLPVSALVARSAGSPLVAVFGPADVVDAVIDLSAARNSTGNPNDWIV